MKGRQGHRRENREVVVQVWMGEAKERGAEVGELINERGGEADATDEEEEEKDETKSTCTKTDEKRNWFKCWSWRGRWR